MAALIMFASGPGQSHTFSVFLIPLVDDLGISHTAISIAYAVATLVAAFGLPFVGRAVDRSGSYRVLTVIVIAFGAATIAFSAISGFVLLMLGFGLLRFLGQGSLMLCANNLTSQWFDKKRGIALSLTMLGFSLSVALHPPLAQWLTETHGWQMAWIVMGLGTWLLLLPPIMLLLFDRPEQLGLVPDGKIKKGEADIPAKANARSEGATADRGLDLAQARRTDAFWVILLSNSVHSALATAIFFHQVSIFDAKGLDPTLATSIFSVTALMMVVSSLIIGHLLDRLPTRPLYAAALLSTSLSLVMMSQVQGQLTASAFAFVFGLSNGAMLAHIAYVWPRFFGRAHLGSILGVAQMGMVIGASLGAIPLGVGYDLVGEHDGLLLVLALLPISCAVAVMLMRIPRIDAGPASTTTPNH
ncbi:MFS transporter [Thioalkalivibrio sp. HK1]|uniref:MFS transporter n=1 Tax=Thioalkalivibrio sp. HK1 TaxID=1469245 RepID=UPI001E3CD54D|nr:MFS transporter [Thioalkalivibrio sp. HK1]